MKIAAVILHYNNVELTEQCARSFTDTAPEVDVIIVDNGSDVPYINAQYTVIRREEHGCVGGMNFGFLYCLEKGYDYIINSDNDVICLDGWIKPLIDVMESDSKVGIVGPKQWTKRQEIFRSVGMDLTGGTLYCNYPEETMPVIWLQGSFVMLRASMMREIGLHDTRYHHICSDSDYCLMANDRGWKVVFVADSNVIHYGSTSMNGVCPTHTVDNERLIQKWFGIKFNELANNFPLDIKQGLFGMVTYHTIYRDIPKMQLLEQKDYR